MNEVASVQQPVRTDRSPRAVQITAAARSILEADGVAALTMRRLGEATGMRAPSLYKHFRDKAAVEAALLEEALAEVGAALHAAVARPGRRGPVNAVLAAYRDHGTTHPNLYRLATAGPLDRTVLPAGLEGWAGEPFFLVTGEPQQAQALWAFAHGMVILEIDDRFSDSRHLDATWTAGAKAFSR